MKSITLLSLAALAIAQSSCPVGLATVNGVTVCCPNGTVTGDDTGIFCVLGCTMNLGFDDDTSSSQTATSSCTSVPVTASDYSSRVGLITGASAATTTSSGTQTTTTGNTQASSGANSQTSNSGTTQTSVAGTTQTGSTSSSATPTTSKTSSTSSSSRNAAAMMTAAPFMIVGAIAGAMIV